MNDILLALRKEARTLDDRIHIISACLYRTDRGRTHEHISTTTYKLEDLDMAKNRLEEINIAINGIFIHRKRKKQNEVITDININS